MSLLQEWSNGYFRDESDLEMGHCVEEKEGFCI